MSTDIPRPRGEPGQESRFDLPGEELGLTPIRDAVSSVLRARGLSAAAALAEITSVWQQIVGEQVANRVVPVALHAGELVCEAPDQAWATEMRLLSDTVLARLAEELGYPVATRCSVRVRPRSTQ